MNTTKHNNTKIKKEVGKKRTKKISFSTISMIEIKLQSKRRQHQ